MTTSRPVLPGTWAAMTGLLGGGLVTVRLGMSPLDDPDPPTGRGPRQPPPVKYWPCSPAQAQRRGGAASGESTPVSPALRSTEEVTEPGTPAQTTGPSCPPQS
jgi:hypothetical protein